MHQDKEWKFYFKWSERNVFCNFDFFWWLSELILVDFNACTKIHEFVVVMSWWKLKVVYHDDDTCVYLLLLRELVTCEGVPEYYVYIFIRSNTTSMIVQFDGWCNLKCSWLSTFNLLYKVRYIKYHLKELKLSKNFNRSSLMLLFCLLKVTSLDLDRKVFVWSRYLLFLCLFYR